VPFAAREGCTTIANDVSREPLYLENALPPAHTRSEMAVPLKYGNEVLGVLDIQSDRVNSFSEEDRFILEVLAASISTALRNANLYRNESWRRQVAESYKEIARLFSTQFTLEVVYQAILKELMHNLPCDAAAIWIVRLHSQNNPATLLDLACVEGLNIEKVRTELKRDGKLTDWLLKALQSDQPLIRKAGGPVEPLGKTLHLPPEYSAIAAPLWTTDQLLGLIVLTHKAPNRYGIDAAAMLATFAGTISIAIQNNQLYTSSVEQAWVSTVMLQVSEAAQSAENAESFLKSVARITALLIGVDQCAFYLLDKYSSEYKLMAQEGFKESSESWLVKLPGSPEGKKAFEKVKVDHPAIRLRRKQNSVADISDSAGVIKNNYLLIPLYSRKEMFGVFLVEVDPTGSIQNQTNKPDDQRLNVLQGIARQTALVLENIQLKESGQSEGYITAVLLQVAQTVASSTDLHETFQKIATILPYLVGVDTVLIYQLDQEKQIFNLRGSYSEKWDKEIGGLDRHVKPGGHPLLDLLSKGKKPIFIPHGDVNPQSWNNSLDVQTIQNSVAPLGDNPNILFALPLLVRNELFGALLVSESSQNFAFREKRFEIIREVAQQLAMAAQADRLTHEMVDNERMKREMQLANEIQRTFLPEQLPIIPGWEVDVHWHPARQVSGDFYDAFQLPDGRFGFVIADVSDKGIPAALYMTVTRTLVHASAMDAESPAKTLYQVNKLLLENSQEGLFTTVFYAQIDPKTGEMVYCNAGHNRPGWLKAKEKSVHWLEKGGTALGGFAEIDLCDSRITLNAGDCMVLYTDGVSEARSPKDRLFGVTRLKKFLFRQIGRSAKDLLNDLDLELSAFRQAQPQSDDITVMAIRRLHKK
jgi:sigma-B regulation protein RsbU (phosphoserine phosphatase)